MAREPINRKPRRERALWRRIYAIDDALRRLSQGADVAFDVAMNDGGRAVRGIEARRDALHGEREELVRQIKAMRGLGD